MIMSMILTCMYCIYKLSRKPMDLTTVRSRLDEHSFLDCDDFYENVSLFERETIFKSGWIHNSCCLLSHGACVDHFGVPKCGGL
jgi:hypothetical protein